MRAKSRHPMGAEILETQVGDILVHSKKKVRHFQRDPFPRHVCRSPFYTDRKNDHGVDNTSPRSGSRHTGLLPNSGPGPIYHNMTDISWRNSPPHTLLSSERNFCGKCAGRAAHVGWPSGRHRGQSPKQPHSLLTGKILQPRKNITQNVAEPTAVRQPAEQRPAEQLPHCEASDHPLNTLC